MYRSYLKLCFYSSAKHGDNDFNDLRWPLMTCVFCPSKQRCYRFVINSRILVRHVLPCLKPVIINAAYKYRFVQCPFLKLYRNVLITFNQLCELHLARILKVDCLNDWVISALGNFRRYNHDEPKSGFFYLGGHIVIMRWCERSPLSGNNSLFFSKDISSYMHYPINRVEYTFFDNHVKL